MKINYQTSILTTYFLSFLLKKVKHQLLSNSRGKQSISSIYLAPISMLRFNNDKTYINIIIYFIFNKKINNQILLLMIFFYAFTYALLN